MAIILSIVFIVVAVAARDQLAGFASGSENSATSMAGELVGTEEPGNTGADAQIGQSDSFGIGSTESTQDESWGGELDDDEHDGDHHSDDDDDDYYDGDHDDDDD